MSSSSAAAAAVGDEQTDSLPRRFFGLDPRQLLEDVYNAGDDLVCDGLDAVERLLMVQSSASRGGGGGKALAAEIRAGTDSLAGALLDAHVRPGDKFEVYCLMELFGFGGDGALRAAVETAVVSARCSSAQRQ